MMIQRFAIILTLLLHVVPASAPAAGRIVLDINPTKEAPRNSEGAFLTLKSGKILFLYTQFYGGQADHAPARIVQIESSDAGRTWSADPRIVVENWTKTNVMSVSLLRLASGRIALFYLAKQSVIDCRPVVQFSD